MNGTATVWFAFMFQSTRPRGARPTSFNPSRTMDCFNPRARAGRDGKRRFGLSTVHDYLERATEAKIGWPLPEGLSEEELGAKLFGNQRFAAKAAPSRPQPDWKAIHEQLRHPNIRPPSLFVHESRSGRDDWLQCPGPGCTFQTRVPRARRVATGRRTGCAMGSFNPRVPRGARRCRQRR
jgi:hypothetical protein